MRDAKFYKVLVKLVEKKTFTSEDDHVLWAYCFQFYQSFKPGMKTFTLDPFFDILVDRLNLSVATRVTALACLSKIGGEEVIGRLVHYVANKPTDLLGTDKELTSLVFDVIEGQIIRLSPRYEILHKFEDMVKDVTDLTKRLEALNVIDPNPELTSFLILQKKQLSNRAKRR